MKTAYEAFLHKKVHSQIDFGIVPAWLPDQLFDYQRHVSNHAIRKGRCGVFMDTGLGKTLVELAVASNYVQSTNKPVLIITPLAVAFQFLSEAAKFGIDDIEYSRDGRYTKKIVVCNYERLCHFTASDFDCVILDESSILKNFDGALKGQITAFLKKVSYRFLFTATPSPNDFIELGTSSEALGYLGYTDMLSKFFRNNNDNSIDIRHAGCEWYLKPHAEKDFWRWVASWSISMRKPSDFGYSNERHVLPELIERDTVVNNRTPLAVNGQASLFAIPAKSFSEVKAETKVTISDRCEQAAILASQYPVSVYWVNLDKEAELIRYNDSTAIEIRGKMKLEEKEEVLIAFSSGQIQKLITKPSITAFGLNWQHCNHTTYFPTFSYEQYYQSIRRFYRFGQTRPVIVDRIYSDGQVRIIQSISAKANKANQMFENLIQQTNAAFTIEKKAFSKPVQLPKFIPNNSVA